MDIGSFVIGILILAGGVYFMTGRAMGRVSGWQALSEAEKAAINIRPLCMNIGGMIAICGIIFLITGINDDFKERFFMWAMLIWMAASVINVYIIEKKQLYTI